MSGTCGLFPTRISYFGHANIIKYCNRPFSSVEEMNETLITNWNTYVQPTDTIVHLGDVAFLKEPMLGEVMNRLNGKKVLIRGNHDRDHVLKYFDHTYEGVMIKLGGRRFLLSHYPFRGSMHDDRDFNHRAFLEDPTMFLLCGHVHDQWASKGRMLNMGVDVRNFKPVSRDVVVKMAEVMERENLYNK